MRARLRVPGRIVGIVAVGLVAGWLGLMSGGHTQTAVGPVDVSLALRPSLNGGTVIDVPPLGTLRLNSHAGPVELEAQVARIRPAQASQLISDNAAYDRLTRKVGGEVVRGLVIMLVKAALLALGVAALAGLVVFRGWRPALWSAVAALNGLILVAIIAIATFDPQSVVEPRFTGLLAGAPQLVGDAKSVVHRFGIYREQLAKLVGNVSRLYDVTSTLPTYEPDPTTIRVLHISDIHLNPVAWNVIRSVARQFQIQMIIDTGDLTDHGTAPEEKFANSISALKVPYVFIRGNHDSHLIQQAVAKQKNAIVLDGQTKVVDGLRIYGIGDPRFTPDKMTNDDAVDAKQMLATGQAAAARLRASGASPDVVLTHDPAEGQAFDGLAPLVMCGHLHVRSTRLLPNGSRLFVQGSTGAAGLRGLDHEQPTPIELSVLYFDRPTHRLQGWDNIQLGGLGLTSAQIERTLEPDPDRRITAPPVPAGAPQVPSSPVP
jgi:predicted MPP superfamily phosphohydrolase